MIEETPFPDLQQHKEAQLPAVRRVLEILGKPEDWIDSEGYQHGIEGAALADDERRVAWVECREKTIGDMVDITYKLRARIGNQPVLEWEVDTYNPYFGCEIGYMGWWDDRVVMIYREKHHTMVCSIGRGQAPVLAKLHDHWRRVGDVVYFKSDEPGLVESVTIPRVKKSHPCAIEHFTQTLRERGGPVLGRTQRQLSLIAADFWAGLRSILWPRSAPQPEADLLIGSLAFRFWDRTPAPASSYAAASGRRWNSPFWLPFYWFKSLPPSEANRYLAILEEISAGDATLPDPAEDARAAVLSLARGHMVFRCRELLSACRAGRMPGHTFCYFWVDWSQKAIRKQLDEIFPSGFQEAYRRLAPNRRQWLRLGDFSSR